MGFVLALRGSRVLINIPTDSGCLQAASRQLLTHRSSAPSASTIGTTSNRPCTAQPPPGRVLQPNKWFSWLLWFAYQLGGLLVPPKPAAGKLQPCGTGALPAPRPGSRDTGTRQKACPPPQPALPGDTPTSPGCQKSAPRFAVI